MPRPSSPRTPQAGTQVAEFARHLDARPAALALACDIVGLRVMSEGDRLVTPGMGVNG